jgi:hypothetical protein
MLRFILVCAFAALVLPSVALSRGTEAVPNFDIKRACQALSQLSEARTPGRSAEDATRSCESSEQQAHERVSNEWSQFKPGDRAMCLGVSQSGSVEAVYTELETCLEMARDSELRERSAAVRQQQ